MENTHRSFFTGPWFSHRVALLTAALTLLAPVPLFAEINVGESLDWLTVSRPHIAVAEIVSVQDDRKPQALWMARRFETRLKETLKGKPPATATFTWHVPIETGAPAQGTEFLLFFNDDSTVGYAINLASPDITGQGVAFATHFNVLRTKETILDAVRQRLARLGRQGIATAHTANAANVFTPQRGFLQLEVPFETPAHQALFAGSACYLVVPADVEFRQPLMEQARSNDVWARAKAATKLANYPDDEVKTLLRPLLQDGGSAILQVGGGDQRKNVTVYPARQAAYLTLKSLDEDVEKPEGYYDGFPTSFLQ